MIIMYNGKRFDIEDLDIYKLFETLIEQIGEQEVDKNDFASEREVADLEYEMSELRKRMDEIERRLKAVGEGLE